MKLALPIVALIIAALLGAMAYQQYAAKTQAERELQLLRHSVKHTDSVLVHDTLYFNRKLLVATTLHDTVVKHLTDTVLVARYIQATDSALKACTDVFQSCKASIAVRDSMIAVYKAMKPSRIGLGIIGGCGVGLDAKAACIIGVGGSFTLFR